MFVYYQKPAIGSGANNALAPVQLVFPSGGYGIGVGINDQLTASNNDINGNTAIIISGPDENSSLDQTHKRGLKTAFIILAVFNFIITFVFYFQATSVDTSKVEYKQSQFPSEFEKVQAHRKVREAVNFSFSIITLLVGTLSVITDFDLGLSIFSVSTVLNFLLGTSSIPYFIYSFRYLFDVCLLYIALIYRSKLVYTILPLHIRRQ
jgi:hypothetical protein